MKHHVTRMLIFAYSNLILFHLSDGKYFKLFFIIASLVFMIMYFIGCIAEDKD